MSKKCVLEEEEYVEALEKIIERDFFPDIPKLKRQTLWIAQLAHKAPDEFQRLQNALQKSSSPDSKLSLNSYLTKFTSEDNAAFEVLLKKDQENHRKKYHWAYSDQVDGLNPRLRLLKDGSMMTETQLLEMDKACAAKEQIEADTRENNLDTWDTTARNTLMFMPDAYEDDEKQSEKEKWMLTYKGRSGLPPKAPKETRYENSRFKPVEETTNSHVQVHQPKEYKFVDMTPSPGNATPAMTWGAIGATPCILDPSATPMPMADSRDPSPLFKIKPTTKRELVATKLDKAVKKSIRTRTNGRNTPYSKKTRLDQLTPAAQTMAKRMRSVTPFSSSFRESYRTPARSSSSKSKKKQNGLTDGLLDF